MRFIEKVIRKSTQLLINRLKLAPTIHRMRGYQNISILTYHNIVDNYNGIPDPCFLSVKEFDNQMAYIAANFQVVTIEEAFKNIGSSPKKPLAVITFDDGFQSNYQLALPVLKKYNIPATIFLATGYINTQDTIWFCHVIDALSRTKLTRIDWSKRHLPLTNNKEKQIASNYIQRSLKKLPHKQLMEQLDKLFSLLNVKKITSFPTNSPFAIMTESQISKMTSTGLIQFGAHSINHSILTRESAESGEREITESIEQVAKLIDQPCRLFAYPNGQRKDYNEQHKKLLSNNGVKYCASTSNGLVDDSDDLLAYRRLFINGLQDHDQFKLQVHGLA